MTIAVRALTIVIDGKPQKIAVRLEAPRESPDGGWYCDYTIEWPSDPRHAAGWGVDAFQAIQLTMERIGLDLYTNPYHSARELVWEKPGDGYGFPVPRMIRGDLIGSDRGM